jgi:phage FluMu protein Com
MYAEEVFTKPEELLDHLRVSHEGLGPQCPKCKDVFEFDDFISHLIECSKNESVKQLRRREGLVASKSKPSTVVCDICGKNVNKHYLSRHIITHTGEKNFKCDECGMMLASKQGLKGHKVRLKRPRKHSGPLVTTNGLKLTAQ